MPLTFELQNSFISAHLRGEYLYRVALKCLHCVRGSALREIGVNKRMVGWQPENAVLLRRFF